jgi:hypothetical protein
VAAVVVAGLLGLNTLSGPHNSGVAWAGIPDRVKAIDAFMFRLTIGVRGNDDARAADEQTGQFTFCLSEQHGFRMDLRGGGTTHGHSNHPPGLRPPATQLFRARQESSSSTDSR